MIEVTKPINLEQLDNEYNSKGLIGILDENNNYISVGLADFNDGTEAELQIVIDKHKAQ